MGRDVVLSCLVLVMQELCVQLPVKECFPSRAVPFQLSANLISLENPCNGERLFVIDVINVNGINSKSTQRFWNGL